MYRPKYLKSIGLWVLYVQKKVKGRKVWRRLHGYTFATESMANKFARGNF